VTVYTDVVCPFCGCLCDDLEVTVEDGHIKGVKNACGISRSKFMNHDKNRLESPTIDGVEVPLEKAVDEAADILSTSRRPLVYGLSSTECVAIAKAVELAELAGGVVDNTSSVCHGPTILALQQVGESKTTLGEVKNRADLVIFWGSNPSQAHLRHILRYSGMAKGRFVPNGRKDRYIVAVDIKMTGTARMADEFIKVEPNRDFELLQTLRAAVRGHEPSADSVAGVPREKVMELAERMKAARFGIVFFGLGLTQSEGRHMNIDAAVGLVAELNNHTKFLLTPMRGHYNVGGANTVTTWQTGYPYAVDFSRGYPLQQRLPAVQPRGIYLHRSASQGGGRLRAHSGVGPSSDVPRRRRQEPRQDTGGDPGPEGDAHHDAQQGGDTGGDGGRRGRGHRVQDGRRPPEAPEAGGAQGGRALGRGGA